MSTPTLQALSPLPPGTLPILRPGPSAVAYHIPTSPRPPTSPPTSPPLSALKTTIALPRHSTWTSGLHFHTSHTEYLRLVRGCISLRLGLTTRILSATEAAGGEEGVVVKVDRGVRHEWMRADASPTHSSKGRRRRRDADERPEDWNDDVIVEEWTAPADISKPLFFWNLNGVLTSPASSFGSRWLPMPLQLFVIFNTLDNYPVFLPLEGHVVTPWVGEDVGLKVERWVEYLIALFVLRVAGLVGGLVGVEAVSEERTPRELWVAWKEEKGRKKVE